MSKIDDVMNKRFGLLVVMEEVQRNNLGHRQVRCVCDCGNETTVSIYNLIRTFSCGCALQKKRQIDRMPGQRFGRLVVLERVEDNKWGHPQLRCLCDCGKEAIVTSCNLLRKGRKQTSSCGCLHQDRTRSKQPMWVEYRRYAHHCGKERKLAWQLSFEDFVTLVSKDCVYCACPPSLKTHVGGLFRNGIDRVDNTVGYSADNCVPCCFTCNRMKGTMTHAEFLEHIARICQHCRC